MARTDKKPKLRKTRNMIAFGLIVQGKNRVMRDRRKRRPGDRTDNWRKETE
jgi:hypothetical protein